MITIHYAEGFDLGRNIDVLRLLNEKELNYFFNSIIAKDNGITVYLFTSDHCGNDTDKMEIIITADPIQLTAYAVRWLDYSDCNCFLQEYSSFEMAYKIALDMRENSNLCYEN